MTLGFARSIATNGWAITDRMVDTATIEALRSETATLIGDARGGTRSLLHNASVRALASSRAIRHLAESVLGNECFAARAILFDKTPSANWKVTWHQDLTIATRERVDVPGFGPWTEKEGVPHVQPPIEILSEMLAIRVHLDPCGSDNGPVRVISGTHVYGRLSPPAIDEIRASRAESVCLVEEGGVLAFRPLLLHASSPATRPGRRRVIHIEFACRDLPRELAWRDHVT